jgi:hypothetical protein
VSSNGLGFCFFILLDHKLDNTNASINYPGKNIQEDPSNFLDWQVDQGGSKGLINQIAAVGV